MQIEKKVRNKFQEHIRVGEQLERGNEYGEVQSDEHSHRCIGWLTSAQNVVNLVISNPDNPYRSSVDKICCIERGSGVNRSVGEVNEILKLLLQDIDQGLLTSVENQTKAGVFDDFLDHAKQYSKQKLSNEAGVISGVVFEDTLRSICRNFDIEEKGKPLDGLISDLVKVGVLSQVKAKRARVAAHVRTKATHAQWVEFDLEDVNTTIEFTEELIFKHLDN